MRQILTEIMDRALTNLGDLSNSQLATVAEAFEEMIKSAEDAQTIVIESEAPPTLYMDNATFTAGITQLCETMDSLAASVDEMIAQAAGFTGTRSA